MRKLLVALGGLFLCLSANAQNVAVGSLTASGADCTTAGACITLQFEGNDVASSSIQLSGTFTATVQFEASSDKGTTWVAISGTPLNSTTAVTSATTANTWKFNVASLTNIRARCSAFTSAPTVIIRSSRAVANAIGGGGGAVFASGGTTNNVIPKSNGSSQLANSSITDDGTTVTSTEPIAVPVGTAAAASIQVAGTPGTGFSITSGVPAFNQSGTTIAQFQNSGGAQLNLLAGGGGAGLTFNSTGGAIVNTADSIYRFGRSNLASPTSSTLTVGESPRSGTDSNVAGGAGIVRPGAGTGTGAATKLCLQRNLMGASGSGAQSQIDGYCVGPSKTLSNTTATAQSLVNISVPSNSAGGVEGTITITCTDGTNFDSETQSFNTSFVNKATVLTVTAPVITTTSAANNSGSCTAGITAVAGTNSVDIKVTPAFTTIVPTTVTSYIALRNNGTGNVTFN